MQQDRTFIPGMDENLQNNLYSRQSSADRIQGTFVPGMQGVAPSVEPASVHPSEPIPQQTTNAVPVVGFLYSISRQGIGEYWPLHVGSNTIGRSKDCDICLREMSVSSMHARLNVKQMKTTGAIIATIRDEGSRTGMFVNEEELDYDFHNCKDGDIITIGTSYKLLLIIINAKALGLTVSENFVADNSDIQPESEEIPTSTDFTPYGRPRDRYEGGTIDLSGSNPFEDAGGTQIL